MWKKNSVRFSDVLVRTLLFGCVFIALTVSAQSELDNAARAVRMQDYELALQLYTQVAETGDPEAQYQVSNFYLRGLGTDKDAVRAVEWMQLAAVQGHAAAQYSLAQQLQDLEPDKAELLLRQSAAQGYRAAVAQLDKLTREPDLVEPTDDQLLTTWFESARTGKLAAMQQILSRLPSVDVTDQDERSALLVAVEFGSSNVVTWLLDEGADSNHQDRFGNRPLHRASDKEDIKLVEMLLAAGADSSSILPNGDTLLHYTVRKNNEDLLELFLAQGRSPSSLNAEMATPLDLAAALNNKQAYELLESFGASHGEKWQLSNATDKFDRQVNLFNQTTKGNKLSIDELMRIVISGNSRLLVEALEQDDALVNKSLSDDTTLLTAAIAVGDGESTGVLLDYGADPELSGRNNMTPLQLAAQHGHVSIVRQLLGVAASPLQKNQDGQDAVMTAIKQGQLESVDIMLASLQSNHSTVTRAEIPYATYLLLAAQFNQQPLVEKLALEEVVEVTDEVGRSVLWYAASHANAAIISTLIEAGHTWTSTDSQGRSPFHVVVSSECLECAELLLPLVNIDTQTDSGTTPLMLAVASHNAPMVSWLLAHDADVDSRNKQGDSALILAVQENDKPVVQILLDAGASVIRKNNLGYSALDIARDKDDELYKQLREHTIFGLF